MAGEYATKEDLVRVISALEGVRDAQTQLDKTVTAHMAAVNQVLESRKESCPYQVQIANGEKAYKAVLNLANTVTNVRINMAKALAVGGGTGGVIGAIIWNVLEYLKRNGHI